VRLGDLMYSVKISESAIDDLRCLKKNEQTTVLDLIGQQLAAEPLQETRNRKPLRANDLSQWELRIDRFRVFYDVDTENHVVLIKAVGWKDHNKLYIRGEEHTL
jgi:mRNA-degrading endonuclease RelE of RelBE toxin-antitoxin system